MNIDKLRDRFPNEKACRNFIESIIWQNGRQCPHCGSLRSCQLNVESVRPGVYECFKSKRQFTITTKTPMHSTKLPLWKWLQAMYYIVNSSKVISSVVLHDGWVLPKPLPGKWGMRSGL